MWNEPKIHSNLLAQTLRVCVYECIYTQIHSLTITNTHARVCTYIYYVYNQIGCYARCTMFVTTCSSSSTPSSRWLCKHMCMSMRVFQLLCLHFFVFVLLFTGLENATLFCCLCANKWTQNGVPVRERWYLYNMSVFASTQTRIGARMHATHLWEWMCMHTCTLIAEAL